MLMLTCLELTRKSRINRATLQSHLIWCSCLHNLNLLWTLQPQQKVQNFRKMLLSHLISNSGYLIVVCSLFFPIHGRIRTENVSLLKFCNMRSDCDNKWRGSELAPLSNECSWKIKGIINEFWFPSHFRAKLRFLVLPLDLRRRRLNKEIIGISFLYFFY